MQKFRFDDNHLLTIDFEDTYSKEYSLCFSGYKITSKDKGILVYNKRQWRILHLKEVSSGMQVCYLQRNSVDDLEFNVNMLENVLALFQGFNEESGEVYHYLPFYSKNLETLENDLNNYFGIQLKLSKESQGNFVRGIKIKYSFPEKLVDILSFLFALVVIYGGFDEKKGEVFAVKSHIPLVGGTHIDEELNEVFKNLSENYGIFISSQKVQNGNKVVYQFASNDKDLLSLFVGWMNHYSGNDILKLDSYFKKQQEIKDQLVSYIKDEKGLNIDGKEIVMQSLEQYKVKFIKYV